MAKRVVGDDVVLVSCDWPDCDHTDVLVERGPTLVFCVCHCADDILEEIHYGVRGVCTWCRQICIWWTADGVCIHDRCRRAAVVGGASQVPVEVVDDRVGAYGRRG